MTDQFWFSLQRPCLPQPLLPPDTTTSSTKGMRMPRWPGMERHTAWLEATVSMGMLRFPHLQRLKKRSQRPGGLPRDNGFRKSQIKI